MKKTMTNTLHMSSFSLKSESGMDDKSEANNNNTVLMETDHSLANGAFTMDEPAAVVQPGRKNNSPKSNGKVQIELGNMAQEPNRRRKMRRVSAMTPAGDAVIIRNAEKSYQSDQPVLNGLNMTVPCGSIYGLLGSSGCGKTTVLSCIVGIKKLDRGKIWIYGKPPGTKSIGVPGRNVGFMPQEISLYNEFSIEETLNYFGILNGMTMEGIDGARRYLANLLDLPNKSSRVGSLSGGQQRRVSLVVALLSNPELLILDEPTVGVDPLIRQNIWLHLKKLVEEQRTTVLITTHYIEECRNADNIGIMRNGRLLVERPPTELMLEHGSNNLEKIVLDLSRRDNSSRQTQDAFNNSRPSLTMDSDSTNDCLEAPPNMAKVLCEQNTGIKETWARIRALTRKNFVVLFRNPLWLFFVILCAAVVGALANISQGQDPKDLTLGVVNHEEGNYSLTCSDFGRPTGECVVERLSCYYLSKLKKDIFTMKEYNSESDAIAAVQSGSSWGYIKFPTNFSLSFFERIMYGTDPDELDFNTSIFTVKLDDTSKLVSVTMKVTLLQAFQDLIIAILEDCGYDGKLGQYELKFRQPLFGNEETNFREFLAPGAGLTLLYFFPIITTSIRYIKEKKSGVLQRSTVAGVQTWEVMVAYSISEFFVLLLQSLVNYVMMTQIFQIKIMGSDLLVILFFLVSGYGGVALGFLLGSVCTEEIQAALLALAAFLPNMLLSGVLWPQEGMLATMQNIVQLLPCTLAGEAVRSITSRGWEFTHPKVWPGFVILVAYIVGYFILTLVFHTKFKR